jgi:hypothetical protein
VTWPSTGPVDPAQCEPGIHGRSVGLNAAGETQERTESAGGSIVKPRVEVANALTHNQATEALQQLVTNGDALIISENVFKRRAFVVIQLLGWPQAQPANVHAARPALSPMRLASRVGVWRWPRSAPGNDHAVQE